MDATLIFLHKALKSGLVGEYLKGAIDQELNRDIVNSIATGKVDDAKDRLTALGPKVEAQFDKIAQQVIENCEIILKPNSKVPQPIERLLLFFDLHEMCFRVADEMDRDLLLPGSLVGPETYSLFQSLKQMDTRLLLRRDKAEVTPYGLYVFPKSKKLFGADSLWARYKEAVQNPKEPPLGQVRTKFDFIEPRINGFKVETLTPSELHFEFERDCQKALGAKAGKVDISPVTSWQGIEKMIEGLKEVQDLRVLAKEEWRRIVETAQHISEIGRRIV
jgi:hypothetical protein